MNKCFYYLDPTLLTKSKSLVLLVFLLLCFPFQDVFAADVQSIPFIITNESKGAVTYSLSIKILLVMTLLTVLPALLMTTTAFTRIIIVLAIVRHALGIPNIPSNQIIIGLSLIMTLFVMAPAISKVNEVSLQPYMQGKISDQDAFSLSSDVLKTFMLKQTRKKDLALFENISKKKFDQNNEFSMLILMPAFITSELKTAFEIGFLIFLPFLIIDLVIASILMSMGMMMLSPMVISLPFKILFFVLLDGWSLIVTGLVTSFRV